MKAETKKKIYRFCVSSNLEKFYIGYAICVIAIMTASIFINTINPIIYPVMGLTYFIILLAYTTEAIAECGGEEVVANNNLLKVILSNSMTVSEYILWLIVMPIFIILSMLNIFDGMGFVFSAIVAMAIIIILIKVPDMIADYFDKKLLK